MAKPRSTKRQEAEQAALEYDLRMYGEQEARRRLQEVIDNRMIFDDRRRPYIVQEMQRTAAYMKPDNMRRIRESMGDREAEFRFGLAFETSRQLKDLPHDYNSHSDGTPMTAAELRTRAKQTKADAQDWLRRNGLKR